MQCSEIQDYFADYVKESLGDARKEELSRHVRDCRACRVELDVLADVWVKLGAIGIEEAPSPDLDVRFRSTLQRSRQDLADAQRASVWRRRALLPVAALLVLTISVRVAINLVGTGEIAIVETEQASLYRVLPERSEILGRGASVGLGDVVGAAEDRGGVLTLSDGSRVELRGGSELSFERATDGLLINLRGGSVIVNAASQRDGHLYVQTRDVTVSVLGTVFLVGAEREGSRVAVIEGEVSVHQDGATKRLLPGEQVTTSPSIPWVPVAKEIAWSRNKSAHVALLQSDPKTSSRAEDAPEFEVASVRPNKDSRGIMGGACRGIDSAGRSGGIGALAAMAGIPEAAPVPLGRCILRRMSLRDLIREAYNFRVRGQSVLEGPDWVGSSRFDIDAKAENPDATSELQLWLMLRGLLADRFKLKLHRETRDVSGYTLALEESGHKLREAVPASPASLGRRNGGRLEAQNTTVARLVQVLSLMLDRPVLDRTALSGGYDFTLSWAPGLGENSFMAMVPPDVRAQLPVPAGDPNGPSLFTALREQLGLRLEAGQVPVEILIIDSAELPSED